LNGGTEMIGQEFLTAAAVLLAAAIAVGGDQASPYAQWKNGPPKDDSSNKDVPVAIMVKKHGGATYVFAVAAKPGDTEVAFTLEGLPVGAQVEVLGENRKIKPAGGKFQDHFGRWDVHLYRIK